MRLNITLMAGVAISYFLFIAVSYDHVQPSLLARSDWSKSVACPASSFHSVHISSHHPPR